MYTLFDKLKLKLAEKGLMRLRNASKELQDSERFVRACVENFGAKELFYASENLRSDARFILELVEIAPDVLIYCAPELKDVYLGKDWPDVTTEVVDKKLFHLMCATKNIECLDYMHHNTIEEFYLKAKSKTPITGNFQGKEFELVPNVSDEDMTMIELSCPWLIRNSTITSL